MSRPVTAWPAWAGCPGAGGVTARRCWPVLGSCSAVGSTSTSTRTGSPARSSSARWPTEVAEQLTLSADERRGWKVNGRHDPDLDGCIDVDVAATPLTNTFPIRPLACLEVGGQVTTPIAWVDLPDLGVTRVDQTYRRLPDVEGLAAWEYRDPQHGPSRLTVDTDGFVVTYEGFARRVAATP